eukprot:TRINITY_DN13294_c0_g1_i1.p1 TRINITY_DN13294_c0_g1~~TRINITY_DN13294_c0_g1_i1.p1  ORF type:complete len:112 (-),score=16.59 TRINITY_DN13294_c0_g1_i1:105-440(-)
MLHAGLAANILKSIGGQVRGYTNNIDTPQPYVDYPIKCFFGGDDHVDSFTLKLLPANEEALDAFIAIETEQIKVSISFKCNGNSAELTYPISISNMYRDIEIFARVARGRC